jgi:hypothetical protein
MTTQTTPNSSEQYETIELGIDAHAQWHYVRRQVDEAVAARSVRRASGEQNRVEPRWTQAPAGPGPVGVSRVGNRGLLVGTAQCGKSSVAIAEPILRGGTRGARGGVRRSS